MAIGDQFSGLDMKNLIGAPLGAAADASLQLAHSTAEFINTVGFDKNGKTRTASFKFNQKGANEDGSVENQEMNVDVPLLAIVPIPNLQVDEVNVLFDMEVKQSEKSETSSDYGGSFSATANFGIFKATVSGSVSAHSSNTRSTDNSAKYHVDVSASNHGTPEGLARVLDMMAANVAPALVSSTSVDETGKPLVGDRKAKTDQLKALRAKKFQNETACSAAEKLFDTALGNFKREGSNMQNRFSIAISTAINKEEKGSANIEPLTALQQEINEAWNTFQSSARDVVTAVASSTTEEPTTKLTDVFHIEGVDDAAKKIDLKTDAATLTVLNTNFLNAIKAYQKVLACVKVSEETDREYNGLLCGAPATA